MVLTVKEIQHVFEQLAVRARIMGMQINGCGLRLQECLGVRIKDIEIE